jgi:hypothetical protein
MLPLLPNYRLLLLLPLRIHHWLQLLPNYRLLLLLPLRIHHLLQPMLQKMQKLVLRIR